MSGDDLTDQVQRLVDAPPEVKILAAATALFTLAVAGAYISEGADAALFTLWMGTVSAVSAAIVSLTVVYSGL